MSESKQTAVEWLVEQMRLRKEQGLTISFYDLEMFSEQAKSMEKDNLIMFGAQCMVEVEKESGLGAIKIYELYFDKTFKSE